MPYIFLLNLQQTLFFFKKKHHHTHFKTFQKMHIAAGWTNISIEKVTSDTFFLFMLLCL